MPLLGKVVFDYHIQKTSEEAPEGTFQIPHTKEIFISKEEYDDRVQLYNRKLWTCQCTGHINLTHQEAMESEQQTREMLSRSFPEIFRRPVLNTAHHSLDVLDKIVNKAYTLIRSQLFVEEMVNFEAMPGRKFEVKVVKVHQVEPTTGQNGNGSPSSDKENTTTSKQALITDMFKSATADKAPDVSDSAADTSSDALKDPVKLKYDVLLRREDKEQVVCGVPSTTLTRTMKLPARHLIRLFIRANAVRFDYKKLKAWIVDPTVVEEYDLDDKISKDDEDRLLKASSSAFNQYVGYSPRVPTLTNGSSHNGAASSSSDTEQHEAVKPVIDIEELAINASVGHHENFNDAKPFVNPCKMEAADVSEVPKEKHVKLAPIFSPKPKKAKPETERVTTTSMNSVDYESLAASGSLLEKKPKVVKTATNKRKINGTTETSPKKKKKKITVSHIVVDGGKISDDDVPLSKLSKSPLKSQAKPAGSSRKSTSPKKKKQATLLELTRKKGGMMLMTSKKSHALGSSPSASPSKKPRAPRQPPIVYQLLRLKKDKKFQANHKYKILVNDAARMLNEKQRKNLPDLVKQDILTKWETIERKRKWDNMTPEERKQLRAEERVKRNKKYEDIDIVKTGKAKPLPNYEPAMKPDGLPNTVFGDIAMVTEFLHSYRSLLSPRETKILTQGGLADALCAGSKGYETISRIMILMLHMLLRDGVAQDYKELDFNIDKVPITADVCSELARICLRQLDDDLEEELQDRSDDQIDEERLKSMGSGIDEEVFSKLLDSEIYELDGTDQLEVLCALTYRLINTYSAQQFRDETKERATEAWKKLNKIRYEDNLQKKEEKMKKQQEKREKNTAPAPKGRPKKVKPGPQKSESPEDSPDLISRVKRRRIEAAERRREEEQKRIQWEEEKQRLYDEQTKEAEHDRAAKNYHDVDLLAARSNRLKALGTDRHHNRYWLFSDWTPGLFVEKCWVQDYISYNTQAGAEFGPTPERNSGQTSEDELPLSLLGSPNGGKISAKETSVPHVGQNLWFVIDSKEKLDELIASLCTKGIREGALKKSIEKKYNHIIRSITKYQASLPKQSEDGEEGQPSTRKSAVVKDPDEDAKKALRKRLQSIVQDICRGGLGNIQDDFDVFSARVQSAEQAGEFGTLIIDVFNAIDKRFFREYMSGFTAKKKQKREDLLPYEEQEKLENAKKVAKAEKRRERWIQAVEGSSHFSRLSFLLTILHSSVMWEMYKYCRTMPKRSTRQVKNYAEMVQDSAEDEEEEQEVEEEEEEEMEEEEEDDSAVRRSARLNTRTRRPKRTAARRGLRKRVTATEHEDSEEDDGESSAEEDDDSQEESPGEEDDEQDGNDDEDESQEDDDSQEEEDEEEDEENEDLERCSSVINRVLEYKCSKLFRYPVEEEDVPDYYEVVEEPICLLDVKDRIEKANGGGDRNNSGTSRTRSATRPAAAPPTYSPDQLLEDVRLVLDNAEMYNGQDSFVWRQAQRLKGAFVRCFMENFRHSIRLTKRLERLFDTAGDD